MVALGGNAALVKWRLAFGVWQYSTHSTHFSQNSHLLTLGRWIDRVIYEFKHEKVAQDKRIAQRRIQPPKTRSNSLRAFFSVSLLEA